MPHRFLRSRLIQFSSSRCNQRQIACLQNRTIEGGSESSSHEARKFRLSALCLCDLDHACSPSHKFNFRSAPVLKGISLGG